MMKKIRGVLLAGLIVTLSTAAHGDFEDDLIDRLAGEWIMEGTIAGAETTHDITAEWVLDHNYLRIHEVSREKTEDGRPEYEAIVMIGLDGPSQRYACLWLDSTGGGGLVAEAIGYAERRGDELPFVFLPGTDDVIYNTFRYVRDADRWEWAIDTEDGGSRVPFARVSLTRR